MTILTRALKKSNVDRALREAKSFFVSSQLPPQMLQDRDAPTLEATHVHAVYEAIAGHFSHTRFSPWPVVRDFLQSQPAHSLLGDLGCGNGKYLDVNPALHPVGLDRSMNLCHESARRGADVAMGHVLSLPFRSDLFDALISIAVIHHLITPERRRRSIVEMARVLKPGGQMLIFVWAKEQARFAHENDGDVFVPWHLQSKFVMKDASGLPSKFEPSQELGKTSNIETDIAAAPVYQRYYHLFRKGELDELMEDIDGISIVSTGYDRDNWYVIAKKKLEKKE